MAGRILLVALVGWLGLWCGVVFAGEPAAGVGEKKKDEARDFFGEARKIPQGVVVWAEPERGTYLLGKKWRVVVLLGLSLLWVGGVRQSRQDAGAPVPE